MKAILEFNLPDDQEDFDMATKGLKWYMVAWEMDQYLRTRLKYEDTISDEQYEAVEKARERLRELMSEHSVGFD